MDGQTGTPEHLVTAEHLKRLATVDRKSLFAAADALIDAGDEITRVPFSIVTAALEGRTKLACCRLLYARGQFLDDGVVIGATPRTTDGTDLGTRLTAIADGLNEILADSRAQTAGQQGE
jgi:hypothetical protein